MRTIMEIDGRDIPDYPGLSITWRLLRPGYHTVVVLRGAVEIARMYTADPAKAQEAFAHPFVALEIPL
jgi:hypothetical protein